MNERVAKCHNAVHAAGEVRSQRLNRLIFVAGDAAEHVQRNARTKGDAGEDDPAVANGIRLLNRRRICTYKRAHLSSAALAVCTPREVEG